MYHDVSLFCACVVIPEVAQSATKKVHFNVKKSAVIDIRDKDELKIYKSAQKGIYGASFTFLSSLYCCIVEYKY